MLGALPNLPVTAAIAYLLPNDAFTSLEGGISQALTWVALKKMFGGGGDAAGCGSSMIPK